MTADAEKPRHLAAVPENHCLVHAESYVTTCRGCRADEIATEESA